jgi:hypothetical protein
MNTDMINQIEESSAEFPILGYTVIASLKGVEVKHDELLQALTALGFGSFMPPVREPGTTLRRAMSRWLKSLMHNGTSPFSAEEEDEDKKIKRLIREITSRRRNTLTLALVTEDIDLAEYGLSYLTDLRVFYNKDTEELSLTTTPTGSYRAESMTTQEKALLAELLPFWQTYKDTHISGDLSRMVTGIIESMQATKMRTGGGIYFVPYARREDLTRLKQLLEGLPSGEEENTSTLLHLPVVDTKTTKSQMAQIAHRSFMDEVTALQKHLHTFIERAEEAQEKGKQARISTESMLLRLEEYKAMKAKAQLYNQVLDMRQQEILTNLEGLQETARKLMDVATEAEDPLEEAHDQQAPLTSSDESIEEATV